MNDFSISFEYNMQNNTENDILQLPEKIAIEKGIQIVICIDEFNKFRISKIPKRFRKSYVAYGNYNNMSHIVFSEVKSI